MLTLQTVGISNAAPVLPREGLPKPSVPLEHHHCTHIPRTHFHAIPVKIVLLPGNEAVLAKSRSRSLRSLLEVDPTCPERGLSGLCSAHSSVHLHLMNSKKPLSYLFLFLQQDIHQGPIVSEAM